MTLFVSVYLATFTAAGFAAAAVGLPFQQWVALLSVTLATTITILLSDRGRWRIGFLAPPALAAREALFGIGLAILLIGAGDLLIILTTKLRHSRGGGFPWLDLVLVYVPAVFHEEVLFRGYVFQKIRAWNRAASIAIISIVFAVVHLWNDFVTPIAVINLVLAGVLLALAYEVFGRLWFPIGIHFGWNILSGPILGYDVSGYVNAASVLRVSGRGAPWLTGGGFGIEGSAWMIVVEAGAIVWLMNAERRTKDASRVSS